MLRKNSLAVQKGIPLNPFLAGKGNNCVTSGINFRLLPADGPILKTLSLPEGEQLKNNPSFAQGLNH
jgi:hypothetical protein